MCVDYTDLNKACPKDPFGLPRIDLVVDSTAGSELLCFLDAYSGYHQVSLAESDCIKTSFITPFGGILLHHNAVRPEECRSNLSVSHAKVPARSARVQCGSIR